MIEKIIEYLNAECTTLSSLLMKEKVLDYISSELNVHGSIGIGTFVQNNNIDFELYGLNINDNRYIISQHRKTRLFQLEATNEGI